MNGFIIQWFLQHVSDWQTKLWTTKLRQQQASDVSREESNLVLGRPAVIRSKWRAVGQSGLALKWVSFTPNGTNPSQIPSQKVMKSDLKKSWICPISGQPDQLWSQQWHPCLISLTRNLSVRHTRSIREENLFWNLPSRGVTRNWMFSLILNPLRKFLSTFLWISQELFNRGHNKFPCSYHR